MERSEDWGSYVQGGDEWEKIDRAGRELSSFLSCGKIHYPAFRKRLFECSCGVVFPVWMVEAAVQSNDWSMIEEKHKEKNGTDSESQSC